MVLSRFESLQIERDFGRNEESRDVTTSHDKLLQLLLHRVPEKKKPDLFARSAPHQFRPNVELPLMEKCYLNLCACHRTCHKIYNSLPRQKFRINCSEFMISPTVTKL